MSETSQAPDLHEPDAVLDAPVAPGRSRRRSLPRPSARPARGLRASLSRALEQRQFFVLLPFALIVGVVASLKTDAAPEPWALVAVGLALLLAVWLLRRTLTALRMTTLALGFWAGFGLLGLHGALFGTPMLHGSAYGLYRMRVDAVLEVTPKGRRLLVSAIAAQPPGRPLGIRRARIIVRSGPPLAPGDIASGNVYFYEVPGPALPGSFDAEFGAYFQGVGAYGSATSLSLVAAGPLAAPDRLVDGIRQEIGARIAAVLAQPSRGIARAIITGDQTDVEEAPRKTMATAGLAHVMAISGLHLSIVAGSVFFALRLLLAALTPIARLVPVKKTAAIAAIAAALVYYAISGGGAAALRSTVMAVLIFGAVLVGRRALSMRNVAIAGLVTVLWEPAEIFRPGFQLSFAAVIALVGVYEMLNRPRPRRGVLGWIGAHFAGIALTSLVAGAATVVFAIYHFQQTSPLGLVGNLMVMPLVVFVMMPAAMLAVLAMPFGVDAPFIWLMGWSIDRMLDAATLVSAWSSAIDAPPLLTPLALFIALLALCWFAFFTDRYRLAGPLLAIPAIIALALDRPPDVLISDTTQALAIRGGDGLMLIGGRPGSFAVDLWGQTYRQPIAAAKPADLACDSEGCIGRSPLGFTVAVSRSPAALAEDCASADLVVARFPVPAFCRAETTVVDAGDLDRGGAQWLAWNRPAGRFDIRPAVADLNRPWRAGRR